MKNQSVSDPYLTIKNRHNGETLRLSRVRDGSGQVILKIEGTLPPRESGPPPHVHFHQREEGTVHAGTLGAQLGKEKIVVQAGGNAAFPAGVAHCWWNAGDDLLVFHGHATPAADLDRYLQGVFAVLDSSPKGRPSLFYLAHVLWRHRHSQLIVKPPPAVQRIVFPVILAIGHLLGKYQGSDWPGSPESCAGAPEVTAGS